MKPVSGSIEPQTQTDVPETDDGTLVDDTVALVDSDSLVGGGTVTFPDMPMNAKPSVPLTKMKIHR